MIPIVRLFASEAAAREAVEKLVVHDVPRDAITVIKPTAQDRPEPPPPPMGEPGGITPPMGESGGITPPMEGRAGMRPAAEDPAEVVDDAIQRGVMPSSHRKVARDAIAGGQVVVCVTPPYGMGQMATDILDDNGAVDTDKLPAYRPHDPAPFSDMMGLPVLTEGKSHLRLASSNYTFSSMLGMGLLSKKATPLSSMFGMKVLSSQKGSVAAGTPVERMSGEPAPLSSKLGMKLLSSKSGPKAAGTAVERMSGNAAPFSGFLGLKVLSRKRR